MDEVTPLALTVSKKTKLRMRGFFIWFGGTIATFCLVTYVYPLVAKVISDSTTSIYTAFRNEPISQAALMSGITDSKDMMILMAGLGTVVFLGFVTASLVDSSRNLRAKSAVMRRVFIAECFIALGLVIIVLTAILSISVQSKSILIYRAFHTNLNAVLPVISADEEQELRSFFATARTQEDWDALVVKFDADYKKLNAHRGLTNKPPEPVTSKRTQ